MALDNVAALTWNANSESDLASYGVYWGLISGFYPNSANAGLNTTYTVGGLPNQFTQDGRWYFAITAKDTSNNESAKTTAVSKRIIRTLGHIIVRR